MSKYRWLVAALIAAAVLPTTAIAQETGTVMGLVTSQETQQPVQGAQVRVVGTNLGTLTNAQGRFVISNVPQGPQAVQVVFIGYRQVTREVTVGAAPVEVVVQLETDVLGLDELVVIGYGTERRRNVAGAVSSLQAARVAEDIPAPTIENVLQGRVSGVQVVQNSGNPGAAMTIRVRGTASISAGNQPLYVVDGVPLVQGNYSLINAQFGGQGIDALADLNPNDIESIEILKDASAAAIYGSRASNGVVLITTKTGAATERPRVEFNSYYGSQEAWRIPGFLNAEQYIAIRNEGFHNFIETVYGDGAYNAFYGDRPFMGYAADNPLLAPLQPGVDTDWLRAVLRPAAIHNMYGSISGGADRARYFVSGNWFSQDGIVRGFGYERLNARVNLDYAASDRVSLGTNVALTGSTTDRQRGDNTIYGPFANAIANPPVQAIWLDDAQTEYNLNTQYSNPVALALENEAQERSVRITGNMFGTYQVIPEVQARVSVGLDHYALRSRLYDSPIVGVATGSRGQGISGNTFANKIITEGTMNWLRSVGTDHTFSGVVGTSYEQNSTETSEVIGTQFPSSAFRYIASAASITGGTSLLTDWYLLSFFGRASYTFADRITTTFNIRTDGSSRFGERNRYGVFPSASVLWRVSDEAWMADMGFLSDLALRASYGRTGNQQGIANFASWGLFGTGDNYMDTPGIAPVQLPNPDLTWEKTDQLNVGGDVAFLDGRLGFSTDYYVKRTTDLLLNRPIPLTTGFAIITENVGAIENRGIELTTRAHLVRNPRDGFNWTAELNLSRNRNEVTALYGEDPINAGFVSRVEVGQPLGVFYGYVTDGIFRSEDQICYDASGATCPAGTGYQSAYTSPGDIRFRDLNGDGIINAEDREVIGSPWPDYQGGLSNTMSFRGFDLNAFFQFSQGNQIYNATRIWGDEFGGWYDNNTIRAMDRWTPENPDATEPRAVWGDLNTNVRDSDRFVEDGSYVRLKNLVFGYTVPVDMAGRMGFDRVRVYVQGQNLHTWTNYSGFDPEVNFAGDANITRGTDFYTLPQARTLSFGVNIGL
jgi:TonB-dependent starch-binding outer membrane protein SusC